MEQYLRYKLKSTKGFKRLINSDGAIFDKYRMTAVTFIRYASSDFDKQLELYDKNLSLKSINLEQVFPIRYKWLVSNIALKSSSDYLLSLEQRITEFQGGKEDNLKMLVGFLFLKFVLITKIVDMYLSTINSMYESGVDITKFGDLKSIGIGRSILKYLDKIQDLNDKTIDDWLKCNIDPNVAKYYYISMKRVMNILIKEQ